MCIEIIITLFKIGWELLKWPILITGIIAIITVEILEKKMQKERK